MSDERTGTAVVVGAGGGIGGECARVLARTHGHVVCADRDAARAAATVRDIVAAGGEASVVVADAASEGFAADAASGLDGRRSVRTVLYAVAHEEHAPAVELSPESVRLSLRVGPLAAFELFRRLVLRDALTARSALMVIGSLHATIPFAGALGYNLAQAALAQLVPTLAREWAGRGIRVNAIVPGWTRTPAELAFYGADGLEQVSAALPFHRMADPADIAAAAEFLSSERAAYVSGASLAVDGALGASLAALPGGVAS